MKRNMEKKLKNEEKIVLFGEGEIYQKWYLNDFPFPE